MKRRFFSFFFLSAILFLGICTGAAAAASERLKVVASIAPLADFSRQIGGDKVSVVLLLPPGASPHTFEPSPRLVKEISDARIFIKIGAGLEFWADKLVTSAAPKITTLVCSDGIRLLQSEDRDHGQGDPHIWLDPSICVNIVERITEVFSKADPVNSGEYRKNAHAFIEKLRALDREISERVHLFRTKEYVTFHPAWNYFSQRYGLKVAGVIEESPGREPTPRQLKAILDKLGRLNSRIVFAEPQFSPKIAEAVAREAGAKVLFLDPVGGSKGRETYIDTMRYNLAVMEKALM